MATNRKNVASLSNTALTQLRTLFDQYIAKPTDNPVAEHAVAGHDDSLMIHDIGFVAWHQYFIAKLENWLAVNGGAKFIPLPFWDPAAPIPSQLNKNNTNVNLPLPANLRPQALKLITTCRMLNNRLLPYHADMHNAAGGRCRILRPRPPTPFSGPSTLSW